MRYSELIGNAHVPRLLNTLLRNDRLAHAYLFTGQEGLGKKTVALEFARHLLCTSGKLEPCDTCPPCRQFKTLDSTIQNHKGINLRVTGIIPDEKNVSVESIRDEALREIYLQPPAGQRHVLIIDPADEMSKDAMNALLKTLEEPPAYATLILIASRPHRLLPTILSRCQKLSFFPLDEPEVRHFLERRYGSDESARIPWVARFAQGSIGRARRLWEADPASLMALQKQLFDSFHQGRLDALIDTLFTKGAPSGESQRDKARLALEFFLQALRETLRARTASKEIPVFADRTWLKKYEAAPPDRLARNIESLQEAQRAIDLNANVRIAVEDALLHLVAPHDSSSPTTKYV